MNRRVEPAEPLHQIRDPDRLQCRLQLGVVGIGAGEADVVAHPPGEQERLLGHHAELRAQRVQRDPAQVAAVDADRAVVGVVEAADQLGDGGLARAGLADEGHGLAGRDPQVDVVQHRPVGLVSEAHAAQLDLAMDRGQLVRVGRLGHLRLSGEQLAQLDDGGAALLVGVVELHQGLHRREERGREQQEGGHLADADPPVDDHRPADGQQHRLGEDADGLRTRGVHRVDPRGRDVGVAVAPDHPAMAAHVLAAAVVSGDHPGPRQGLLQVRQQRRDPVAHPQISRGGLAPEPQRQSQRRRQRHQQRDRRQQRVVHIQRSRDHHQRECLHQQVDDALLEQHRQGLDVRGHAGHQHPGALRGEEADALALHVREHPDAQCLVELLAEMAGVGDPQLAQPGGHGHGQQVGDRGDGQHRAAAGAHAVVDANLGEHRADLDGDRLHGHQGDRAREPPAVRVQEAAQGEGPAVPVARRPAHLVDDVGWLVRQHPLDHLAKLPRHLGMGQPGGLVGLHGACAVGACRPVAHREHQCAA